MKNKWNVDIGIRLQFIVVLCAERTALQFSLLQQLRHTCTSRVAVMPKTYVPPFDLPARFPFLEYKTAIRLHPRQRKVEDPRASKIGGHIAWPVDEEVPRCPEDKSPMIAVLQLRKEDVPEMPFPEGKNLFQMLWCPRDLSHEEDRPEPIPAFYWRDSEALVHIRDKLPDPVDPEGELCPKECALSPERVEKDLPSGTVMDFGKNNLTAVNNWIRKNAKEELDRINGWLYDFYRSYFSVVPGTKVGGYADFGDDAIYPPCDHCKKQMEHLLTIASSEETRLEPFVEGKMTPAQREAKENGPNLCIGDVGNYHVFICRRCEDWPTYSFALD